MEIGKPEVLYNVKMSSWELNDIRRCILMLLSKENDFDDDEQKHRCQKILSDTQINTKEPASIVIDR